MIDAAILVLEMKGVDLDHVYFDKFTNYRGSGGYWKEVRGPETDGQ